MKPRSLRILWALGACTCVLGLVLAGAAVAGQVRPGAWGKAALLLVLGGWGMGWTGAALRRAREGAEA